MTIKPVPFAYDGDTTMQDGSSRRLIGINAPEMKVGREGWKNAGADESKGHLEQLLKENPDAVWESVGTDKYGRDLGRYVTKDGRDLNAEMVRKGYASSMEVDGYEPYYQQRLDYAKDVDQGKDVFMPKGELNLKRKTDPSLMSEFKTGTRRGVDQTQMLFGYGLNVLGRATGLDGIAEYGEEVARKNFEEAQQNLATVASYKDIETNKGIMRGLEDTARYAIGIIGEQVPQIATDVIAAATTGGLGVIGTKVVKKAITDELVKTTFKNYGYLGLAGSQYAQMVGEVEANLREHGIDSPTTALAAGLSGTALDFIGAKSLIKIAGGWAKKGNKLVADTIIKQGLKGTLLEGGTEALQEVNNQAAVLYHKTGYDIFSEENVEDYINSFLAGAIIGGTPATIKGTFKGAKKLLTPNEVEEVNKEFMGFSKTRTESAESDNPNKGVVFAEWTNDKGETVKSSDEVTDDTAVTAQVLAERLKNEGITDPIIHETTAEERLASRGNQEYNGDRVEEDFVTAKSEVLELETSNRVGKIISMKHYKTLQATHQDLLAKLHKVFVDGEVYLSRNEAKSLELLNARLEDGAEYVAPIGSKKEAFSAVDFTISKATNRIGKAELIEQVLSDENIPTEVKEIVESVRQDNTSYSVTDTQEEIDEANAKNTYQEQQDILAGEDAKNRMLNVNSVNDFLKENPPQTYGFNPVDFNAEWESQFTDIDTALNARQLASDVVTETGGSVQATNAQNDMISDMKVMGINAYSEQVGLDAANLVEALKDGVSNEAYSEANRKAFREILEAENIELDGETEQSEQEAFVEDSFNWNEDDDSQEAAIAESIEAGFVSEKSLEKMRIMRAKKGEYAQFIDPLTRRPFTSAERFLAFKRDMTKGEWKDVRSYDEGDLFYVTEFGAVDEDTGEVSSRTKPLYMPDAVAALMRRPEWRYNTTMSFSGTYEKQADAFTEILGYLEEKDNINLAISNPKQNMFLPVGYATHDFFREENRTGHSEEVKKGAPVLLKEVTYFMKGGLGRDYASSEDSVYLKTEKLDKVYDEIDSILNKDGLGYSDELKLDKLEAVQFKLEEEIEETTELRFKDSLEQTQAEATETDWEKAEPLSEVFAPTIRDFASVIMSNARAIIKKARINTPIDIIPTDGKNTTVLNDNGRATIHINFKQLADMPRNGHETAMFVVAHELGHVAIAETMHHAPQEVLAKLHADYKKARARVQPKHPYRKQKGVGFDEWLADQFAIHFNKADGKSTDSFFKRVGEKLTKILDAISDLFGVGRLSQSQYAQEVMQAIFKTKNIDKIHQNPEFRRSLALLNLSFGGNRPNNFAENRRNFVNLKALGKEDTWSSEPKTPRDYTLGQAINDSSTVGKAIISRIKHLPYKPSDIASAINNALEAGKGYVPIVYTAYSELKGLGARGEYIAKKYADIFDKSSANSTFWRHELNKVMAGLKSENGKEYKASVQAFINGETDAPPEISSFLKKFYKYLKTDMPTLGELEGFFPRVYDREQVEKRADELVEIILKAAEQKGFATYTESSVREVVQRIANGSSAFENVDYDKVRVHGNEPSSKKTRVFDFVSDKELRLAGFLEKDIELALGQYVSGMVRRKHFERNFSAYTNISQPAAFLKLFMGIDLRDEKGKVLGDKEKLEILGDPDVNFFNRNKRYFKQAMDTGWLIEQENEDGKLVYAFYDQNYWLRNAAENMRPEDRNRLVTILDALEGRLGADKLSPKVRKAMSTAVAYQNWLTLLFSGFSQMVEISGLIFRNRDLDGAFDSLNEIRKLLFTKEGKQQRELMDDLGFAERQLAMQALLESMGVNYQSSTAQKMNNALFKLNGMNFITNASRVMGAAVAERFIIRHAKKAKDGSARSVRMLKELGLSVEDAEKLSSPSFKHYSHYVGNGGVESADAKHAGKILEAMHKFVDSAIVRPNAIQRPVWGSDPRWMLVWHLKSFMYAYGHTILGGLFNEIKNTYRENIDKGAVRAAFAASAPFLVYAIPVLLLSGLGLELREFIQYTVLGFGSRPYSDSLYGADYVMEMVKRGGMLGPFEMGYSFVENAEKGRSSLAQVLGPTFSQLETLLHMDAAKSINRSVPILSQNPMMKNWVREILAE